jgi:hypothetical protein
MSEPQEASETNKEALARDRGLPLCSESRRRDTVEVGVPSKLSPNHTHTHLPISSSLGAFLWLCRAGRSWPLSLLELLPGVSQTSRTSQAPSRGDSIPASDLFLLWFSSTTHEHLQGSGPHLTLLLHFPPALFLFLALRPQWSRPI